MLHRTQKLYKHSFGDFLKSSGPLSSHIHGNYAFYGEFLDSSKEFARIYSNEYVCEGQQIRPLYTCYICFLENLANVIGCVMGQNGLTCKTYRSIPEGSQTS